MEFAAGGDMFQYVKSRGGLDEVSGGLSEHAAGLGRAPARLPAASAHAPAAGRLHTQTPTRPL